MRRHRTQYFSLLSNLSTISNAQVKVKDTTDHHQGITTVQGINIARYKPRKTAYYKNMLLTGNKYISENVEKKLDSEASDDSAVGSTLDKHPQVPKRLREPDSMEQTVRNKVLKPSGREKVTSPQRSALFVAGTPYIVGTDGIPTLPSNWRRFLFKPFRRFAFDAYKAWLRVALMPGVQPNTTAYALAGFFTLACKTQLDQQLVDKIDENVEELVLDVQFEAIESLTEQVEGLKGKLNRGCRMTSSIASWNHGIWWSISRTM
ncbi:hypothetical protein COCMIDRAFT_30458 [Bipolaris oryzae ATCC 44560]|uniref:Uncharacterized protein n=1 Tax=Bipolaris oryzae ATCC 44560 TaxID=930090 RepID=W6YSX9_COCMI|nr:uncharacterized protein COCMIDRAFT_30458 [Bipolaris oryzae ATCC 44560]EUC40643.1 hypothetical protein COCMIDRAFT_30458 [Bipolaris oryzae ATCC 44560]